MKASILHLLALFCCFHGLSKQNTLITEGTDGRLFEVTPEHEIIWEYISPYFGKKRNHITSRNGFYTNRASTPRMGYICVCWPCTCSREIALASDEIVRKRVETEA